MPSPEVEPEMPPEVQKRRVIAMSQQALDDNPKAQTEKERLEEIAREEAKARIAAAKKKLKKVPGQFEWPADPLMGLKADQIEKIRGKNYPKAPDMDPLRGDKDQAFADWLFQNHPWDAVIRYYGRDVYPSKGLVVDVPPVNPYLAKPKKGKVA